MSISTRNGWYADKRFGQIDQLRENDFIEDVFLIRKFSSKGFDADEKYMKTFIKALC